MVLKKFQGMFGGLAIMVLAVINLGLFFGLDGHPANEVISQIRDTKS